MTKIARQRWAKLVCMSKLDRTDAKILLALCAAPRATGVQLATMAKLARNTVQTRLTRWDSDRVLAPVDRCVSPADLGYPLRAFVTAVVNQHEIESVIARLETIAEVTEAVGISGAADLHIEVVATDTDDLYRISGVILAIAGVERTTMSVVMRQAIGLRTKPLLKRVAEE